MEILRIFASKDFPNLLQYGETEKVGDGEWKFQNLKNSAKMIAYDKQMTFYLFIDEITWNKIFRREE